MKRMILAMAAVMAVSSAVMAETVYLHDGQVFRGDIIDEKYDYVVIRTDTGREERIDADYIKSISRDEPARYQPPRRTQQRDFRRNESEVTVKLGVDFNGTHESSVMYQEGTLSSSFDISRSVDTGLSFSGEYVSFLSPNIGLGGGITFQSYRSLKDLPGQFSFTPLYGILKLRTTPVDQGFYQYITGHLGYNMFSGDRMYSGENGTLNGGLYWGVGAGVSLNRIQLELLYTEHNGTAKDSGYIYNDTTTPPSCDYFSAKGDINYSKVGLNIGLKF